MGPAFKEFDHLAFERWKVQAYADEVDETVEVTSDAPHGPDRVVGELGRLHGGVPADDDLVNGQIVRRHSSYRERPGNRARDAAGHRPFARDNARIQISMLPCYHHGARPPRVPWAGISSTRRSLGIGVQTIRFHFVWWKRAARPEFLGAAEFCCSHRCSTVLWIGRYRPLLAALLRRLLQSHACPSTILVDELDAGLPQYSLYRFQSPLIPGIAPDLNVGDRVPM
jgi:hypothetical protein